MALESSLVQHPAILRSVLFEQVRSIWLPRNALYYAVTLATVGCSTLLVSHPLAENMRSSLHIFLAAGAALCAVVIGSVLTLMKVEDIVYSFSYDVRQDRSLSFKFFSPILVASSFSVFLLVAFAAHLYRTLSTGGVDLQKA